MKKTRLRSAGILATSIFVFSSSASIAQSMSDVDRINKNWDKINKDHTLNKEWQKPGEFQKPGEIQKAGEIQIPRGMKAIQKKTDDCTQRFSIGADTLFEFDKATLNKFALETLNVLKPMIEKLGPHPIKVEGHTDSKGTDDYNQKLSERRAERVKNWLLENHVSTPGAVTIEGFGELRPIARNQNPDGSDYPEGRQKNRRVEIVVDTCKKLEAAESSSGSPGGTAGAGDDSKTDAKPGGTVNNASEAK